MRDARVAMVIDLCGATPSLEIVGAILVALEGAGSVAIVNSRVSQCPGGDAITLGAKIQKALGDQLNPS